MADEMNGFVKALQEECAASCHESLVDGYIWANSTTYGSPSPELRQRGEEWAKSVEERDLTYPVLAALYRDE